MPRTANPPAPYLTHVVSHHGQLTLIPPQNAARIRKPSPARSARNTNSPRSESNRSMASPSPSTRARSPTRRSRTPTIRRPQQRSEMTVPDFPPPTFQEAIRDPIYLAATAAPSVASFSSYHSVRTRTLSEISYPTTSASSPVDGSIYQDAFDDVADRNTSNSDSDSCELEMVSVDHYHAEWEDDRRQGLPLEERVRRDLERRKLAEPSPSVMSRERACSHCGASRTLNDSQSSIGVSAAPSTPEQQEPPNVAPAPVARRRLLRHKHSQSLSASVPSTPTSGSNQRSFPSSDPHRRSRSMSPTPRPGSPSSMFSHKPSLSSMSRRLFSSSRGKERSPTEEPLESWEVVPSGSSEAQNEVPVSRMRRSLSGMALSSRASSESSNTPTISPYPLQQTSMPQIPSEKNSSRFNLSSIQDRPPPPIPPAFQNRPIRAPPPAPPPLRQSPLATNVYSPFSESPAPSVSLPSPEVDPPSPKKSRRPPPPPSRKKPPSINAALAQRGTRQRFQSMSVPRTAPTVPFPPLSPTQDDRVSHMSRFRGYQANPFNPDPFPHDFRSSSPQSEVSYTTALSDQEDESKSKSSSLLTIRPQARGTYVNNSLARLRSPQTPTSPTLPALLVSPTSPVSPRSGHHYNGRPLPLPPPGSPITATPITQTHFGFGDEKAPIRLIDAQLNQNTGPSHNYPINPFNANFSRAQSPPLFDPSRMYAPVHVPTPPYVHPTPLIDARMYFPIYAPPPRTQSPAIFDASRLEAPVHIPGSFPMHTHVIVDASRLYSTVHAPTAARTQPLMPVDYPTLSASARVPPSPSSITSRSSVFEVQGAGQDNDYDSRYSTYTDDDTSTIQSEMTDLDALIARIDGESDDGGNYEDLLMVSEVLGRATPQPESQDHNHQERFESSLGDKADITPFVGRVEVQRRRVTKNGRVKLKLTLLGIGVDNCGVCLSQFRDADWGALGPRCQHSYHERCLKKWLARSSACPLCRVPLDEDH